MRAAVATKLGRGDLEGIRVAVQGLGEVGREVCRRLGASGAKLVVADVNAKAVEGVVSSMGALPVPATDILFADVDVLAPCALGAVLDVDTIPKLRCKIVAGSANNQLATPIDAERLEARGILFAPDFVVNAGGVISAGHEAEGEGAVDPRVEEKDAKRIAEVLAIAFIRSEVEHVTPYEAAVRMAREKIAERRAAA